MRLTLLLAALVLSLSACTFVKMAPGAENIQVVPMERELAGCQRRGEIEVSVKDRLGPYSRNDIRVRDELETLARNSAPNLQADTIQPKSAPNDGAQRFVAWRCAAISDSPPASGREAAQTSGVQN